MDNLLLKVQNLISTSSNKRILIGICGVPGSGKSTSCKIVSQSLNVCSIVVPMDGFHIFRKDLDDEGIRRRGAPFTINAQRFVNVLKEIKRTGCAVVPAFDHAEKDPRENAIEVNLSHEVIFVEGLYLLLDEKPWDEIVHILDAVIFLDMDVNEALSRCAKRNAAEIGYSLEESWKRIHLSDSLNASLVDSSKHRATSILKM